MMDRPAIRAEGGILSRPVEHVGLREARVSSHQEGVVDIRDRVESRDETGGREEDGRVLELEEETVTKCVLRVLAMEDEFMLKEDQLLVGEDEAPASLRVFQSVVGCVFLLSRRWKYSFLALRCSPVTRLRCALKASHDTARWFLRNNLNSILRLSISSLIDLVIQGAGFFFTRTVLSVACLSSTSQNRVLNTLT